MKATLVLLCVAWALSAYADDPPAQFSSTALKPLTVTEAERIQKLLQPRQGVPVIAIGRSDFVFSGPLAYGFRRLPHEENLSRSQKFLRLPVIRLFVPGPMERPPGGTGKYFAWKSDECSLPWTLAASRPPLAKGPE